MPCLASLGLPSTAIGAVLALRQSQSQRQAARDAGVPGASVGRHTAAPSAPPSAPLHPPPHALGTVTVGADQRATAAIGVGIVRGSGTARDPYLASLSSFPVPQSQYTRLLNDDRGALAPQRLSLTALPPPHGASRAEVAEVAEVGAAAAAAAGGASASAGAADDDDDDDDVAGDDDDGAVGVRDADLSNARYRHRLAGLVASPAAAVAIGLAGPRLSYASRHRPMIAAPVPARAVPPLSRPLVVPAAAPASLRALQEQGPLSLLSQPAAPALPPPPHRAALPDAAAAAAAADADDDDNGAVPAESATGEGHHAAGSDGRAAAAPASESPQRSVVFGRHAIAFPRWPLASSLPLLTDAPRAMPLHAASPAASASESDAADGSGTTLVRLHSADSDSPAVIGGAPDAATLALGATPLLQGLPQPHNDALHFVALG